MDCVLIVDPEEERTLALRQYLAQLNQFQILTARSGEEAAAQLHASPVSLVVTRLALPGSDGLDLLAHISRQRGIVVCIVLDPVAETLSGCGGVLQWLPLDADERTMAAAIFEGLSLVDEGTGLGGFRVSDLISIAERLRKSARIEITSPSGEKGFLYFREGHLIDAHCGERHGDTAAERLASWERVQLQVAPLPGHRGQPRIEKATLEKIGAGRFLPPERQPGDTPYALPVTASGANAPHAGDERFAALLKNMARELLAIKGWSAVAILAPGGRMLAVESPGSPATPLAGMGEVLAAISERAAQAAAHCRLQGCKGLTMQTERQAVMMRPITNGGRPPYYLVGILTFPGNFYFMQMQLERATAHLASRLREGAASG